MFNQFHQGGIEALNQQNYERAKILFLQAISQDPTEPESYFFLGESCFLYDEQDEAVKYLIEYIKLSKQHNTPNTKRACAYDLLGQCYAKLNMRNETLLSYKLATLLNPSSASAWHNRGLFFMSLAQSHLQQKNHDEFSTYSNEAYKFIKEALRICSTIPMFLHSFAQWHATYVEALEQLNIESLTIHEDIYKNVQLAIEHYQEAVKFCSKDDSGLRNIILANHTRCLSEYGYFFYHTKDYENAEKWYLQALQLTPNHIVSINQMGMICSNQKRFDEAIEYFASIFTKTDEIPEHADAALNLAYVYRQQNRLDKAEEMLTKAELLTPPGDHYITQERDKLNEAKQEANKTAENASLIKAPQVFFKASPVTTNPKPPASTKDTYQP
ncbi:MAG: tetratricopeptide repeat protein [Legionella sp.]|uniref:tetratricopeptide repeat protein n=1 Tax=Legionella sp. TaxID=459 RepID=UPI0039E37E75